MGLDAMILVFSCWVSSQLFPSPLSPLSRGTLVPLQLLPLEWYHQHIWGCRHFSWQSWFQLVTHPARHSFIYLPPPHYVGGWRGPRSSILGLASTTMTTCSVSGQPWCPLSSLVIWKKVFPNLPAVSVGPEREADPSQLPHRHFHDKKLVEKRRHGVLFVKDF